MADRTRQPRGLALILVMMAVAVATVLGLVMLNTATLQNRAGENAGRLAAADYLAESGINLAAYYLQHSDLAPTLNSAGYWPGTNGDISLGSSTNGTVNVTATQDAADVWSYEITSVAKVGNTQSDVITKTTGARIYVRNQYTVKQSAVFNNNVTLGQYISTSGDVWCAKQLTVGSPLLTPQINGFGYTKNGVGAISLLCSGPVLGFASCPNTNNPAPNNTDLNLYQTYSIGNIPYTCSSISSSSITSTSFSPTISNPGGVLYKDATSDGPFTLNGNVTINGTLVVNGDCTINGIVNITAQPNFPALVVTGNLIISSPGKSLTVNGLCYVGNTLKMSGSRFLTYSTFVVNGAFLGGSLGGVPIDSGYKVTTTFNYNASLAVAPDMTSTNRSACGISIVRWGLPGQ